MFKFNHKDFKEFEDDIKLDIGIELRDKLAEAYALEGEGKQRGTPYEEARITHCPTNSIVGSEDWAPFIVNEGWCYGKFPNIQSIKQWVRFTKDNGANIDKSEEEIDREAYLVARKIANEGIIPTWFVDKAMFKFQEANK